MNLMIHHGILLVLLLIGLTLAYLSMRPSPTDGFTDLVPDLQLQTGQERFNLFSPLINLLNPQLPLTPDSNKKIKEATQTLVLSEDMPGEYQQKGVVAPYQVPKKVPESIDIAQKVCESVQGRNFDSSICSNFDKPDFAKYCGITFDLNSTNSKGTNQGIGGLYLSLPARQSQGRSAPKGTPPESMYSPTYGTSKVGTFVVDKETCMKTALERECSDKQMFEGDCAQSYSPAALGGSLFHHLDPATEIVSPTLILLTNAPFLIITVIPNAEGFQVSATPRSNPYIQHITVPDSNTPVVVDMPELKEGNTFMIKTMYKNTTENFLDITAPTSPPSSTSETVTSQTLFLAGFLKGQTLSGPYSTDIKYLIFQQGYQPRLQGMIDVTHGDNTVRCWSMRPDVATQMINLRFIMPFSFVSISSNEANNSPNGPFIKLAKSAAFLNSDPCQTKDSAPGHYSPQC